jgi:hypothetical protein
VCQRISSIVYGFCINNKLHINFSTPQYRYKFNDFKSSYTALGSSLKFTHTIMTTCDRSAIIKIRLLKEKLFLFVLASQIDVTFLNGFVRINRHKKDKIRGTIARYVMCTISTEVLKTCLQACYILKSSITT